MTHRSKRQQSWKRHKCTSRTIRDCVLSHEHIGTAQAAESAVWPARKPRPPCSIPAFGSTWRDITLDNQSFFHFFISFIFFIFSFFIFFIFLHFLHVSSCFFIFLHFSSFLLFFFFFLHLSFLFLFFFFFCSGLLEIRFFFGLNCFKISCNISVQKIICFEPSRGVPLWALFSFLSLVFFFNVPLFFFFFVHFFSRKKFLLSFFLVFLSNMFHCWHSYHSSTVSLRSRCSMEMWCPDNRAG